MAGSRPASAAKLSEPIVEQTFKSMAFHAPLLMAGSIEAASAEQLEEWMGGARLMIRESFEDKGLLILGKEALLRPLLDQIGLPAAR